MAVVGGQSRAPGAGWFIRLTEILLLEGYSRSLEEAGLGDVDAVFKWSWVATGGGWKERVGTEEPPLALGLPSACHVGPRGSEGEWESTGEDHPATSQRGCSLASSQPGKAVTVGPNQVAPPPGTSGDATSPPQGEPAIESLSLTKPPRSTC